MDIQVKELARVALLNVRGRVDSNTAQELGENLRKQIDKGNRNLVADLSGVEYMSSAGLRELVGALKTVKATGGDLRIAAPSDRVREVLELAGLQSVFIVFDDTVSAVGSY
jgi:anti-sigma B factor antagonist